MRHELITQIEDLAKRDYDMGLCHVTHPDEITELEMKMLYARTIETVARKTVNAILDDKPRRSK